MQFEKHKAYFLRCLSMLPAPYTSSDTSRLTLAYFCIVGLDLLQYPFSQAQINDWKEWIYSHLHQTSFDATPDPSEDCINGGFAGSHALEPSMGNLAMTYAALCTLRVLGDDYTRIKKSQLLSWMKLLQTEDGRFKPVIGTNESDVRYLYCACAISALLADWSAINIDCAICFIKSCMTYDGAFGQKPFGESHGGSTYCALSCLALMKQSFPEKISIDIQTTNKILKWLLGRQSSGFQGRVNKPVDTCYTFWINGSLAALEILTGTNLRHLVDCTILLQYLSSAESPHGGFGKEIDDYPDVLHSYLTLAGLSLTGQKDLKPSFGPLNIPTDRLNKIC